jgi:hypothetical protein
MFLLLFYKHQPGGEGWVSNLILNIMPTEGLYNRLRKIGKRPSVGMIFKIRLLTHPSPPGWCFEHLRSRTRHLCAQQAMPTEGLYNRLRKIGKRKMETGKKIIYRKEGETYTYLSQPIIKAFCWHDIQNKVTNPPFSSRLVF